MSETDDEVERQKHQVSDAATAYVYDAPVEISAVGEGPQVTRISAKNQVTLPVRMVKQMRLGPGDEIELTLKGRTITLRRRPTRQEALDELRGSLSGLYEGAGDIDQYIRTERASWEREWDPD